ncbi:MAG: glycosyltransferase family 87 protein [Sphingomicrobium sp.]
MRLAAVDGWSLDRGAAVRYGLLFVALATGIIITLPWIIVQFRIDDYLGDFQLFWKISQIPVHDLYGPVALARDPTEASFVFPYPPTALLLILPFGALPFPLALATWSLLGLLAMTVAARRIVEPKAIFLGFFTAAVLGVTVGGQVSLFVGGLIIGGG